jgi:hypothetical protein
LTIEYGLSCERELPTVASEEYVNEPSRQSTNQAHLVGASSQLVAATSESELACPPRDPMEPKPTPEQHHLYIYECRTVSRLCVGNCLHAVRHLRSHDLRLRF